MLKMKLVTILYFISFGVAALEYNFLKCCNLIYNNMNSVEHVCLQTDAKPEKNCSSQFEKLSLAHCSCSENNVKDVVVGLDVLKKFFNLKSIDLSFLELKNLQFTIKCEQQTNEVEKYEICPLETKILNVSHNYLQHIEPNIFVAMPNVTELDASFNLIVQIQNFQLLEAFYLEVLNVSDNRINSLTEDIFTKTKSLKLLDLRRNQLTKFNFNIFSPPVQFVEVHLDSHNITELDISCYQSSCHFKEFNTDDFFDKLQTLRASGNSHINLSKLLQQIGENLLCLDLSHIPLGQIDDNTLKRFTNLKILNMSHSNILNITPDAFTNQTNSLFSLDLSDNDLMDLTAFSHNFTEFQVLYLTGNPLTTLDQILSENFIKLDSLAISRNNFSCVYLRKFLKNSLSKWTNLNILSDRIEGEINIDGIDCVVIHHPKATKTKQDRANTSNNLQAISNGTSETTWLYIYVGAPVGFLVILICLPATIWMCYEKITLSKYKAKPYHFEKATHIKNPYIDTMALCSRNDEEFEDIPLGGATTLKRNILNKPLPKIPTN